jgi:hypothetical protein
MKKEIQVKKIYVSNNDLYFPTAEKKLSYSITPIEETYFDGYKKYTRYFKVVFDIDFFGDFSKQNDFTFYIISETSYDVSEERYNLRLNFLRPVFDSKCKPITFTGRDHKPVIIFTDKLNILRLFTILEHSPTIKIACIQYYNLYIFIEYSVQNKNFRCIWSSHDNYLPQPYMSLTLYSALQVYFRDIRPEETIKKEINLIESFISKN